MSQLWLLSAVLPQALRHMYRVLPSTTSTPSVFFVVQHYTIIFSTEECHSYLNFFTWHYSVLLTTFFLNCTVAAANTVTHLH